jgi:hypothetical protein
MLINTVGKAILGIGASLKLMLIIHSLRGGKETNLV